MRSINANVGALVALRNLEAALDEAKMMPDTVFVIDKPDPVPAIVLTGDGRSRAGSKKHAPRYSKYVPHQGAREIARRLRKAQP